MPFEPPAGARHFHCPAGTILFRAGDACQGFVDMRAGSIRVSLTAANGRDITLYRVGAGEVCLQTFTCLVEGKAYSAEGVAETAIEAWMLPPTAFQSALAQDDAFRARILRSVAHRFSDFAQLVEDVALTGFEPRLARAILRLADAEGLVRETHEALARETGSGRAVVSRQMADWVRRGLVSARRGETRIEQRSALAAIAEAAG